jgi:hypothetical protein
MVMAIQEDGWRWSETELTSYKILKMPGVLPGTLAKFMERQIADPLAAVKETYRRRAWMVDLSKLTKEVETTLNDSKVAPATRYTALNAISTEYAKDAAGSDR